MRRVGFAQYDHMKFVRVERRTRFDEASGDDVSVFKRCTSWLLWVLIPALPVTFLWLWLWPPVPEPDAPTAEALEVAAERWWRPDGVHSTIPEADWPPELRRLAPRSVRVTPEGVYIPFGSRFVEEWGLFVLPAGSDFQPQSGTDPSFRLVRGRVYRYDIQG